MVAEPEMSCWKTICVVLGVLCLHLDVQGAATVSLAGAKAIETNAAVGREQEQQETLSGSTLYYPDYVVGGGWSVQLVLTNDDASQPVSVVVDVYDQQGRSQPTFFGSSGNTFEIPAQGSRVLSNTGASHIQRGWIEVRSPRSTVGGLLTYRQVETGIEVGVQSVPLSDHFALFIEETSDIGTGLAILNSDASPQIEFRLRDSAGNDPLGETLTRGDFKQQARTIPEWLEGVEQAVLRDFRGLLFLRTTDGSDFAPLGLRFGKQKVSLSAVPVMPVPDLDQGSDVQPTGPSLIYPDYVVGGGWSVQLVLCNIDTARTVSVVVDVYDQQGRSQTTFFGTSGNTFEIPAQGSRVLRNTGASRIQRGWVEVRSPRPTVRGLLTYRQIETGIEVGVEAVPPRDHFSLFVEETSDIGTGLAIFKPNASPPIEFRLRDSAGNDPLGETLTRGGFKQQARTIPEWLEGIDQTVLRDFRGLLFLRASDGSDFAPLGLRFGKLKVSLSAVPVIAIPDPEERGSRPSKMYWAVRGGGFVPQIQRANLDGSGVEDLVKDVPMNDPVLGQPIGIALDVGAGKMYWTVENRHEIQRANLDGSGVETVLVLPDSPTGIALDVGAGKMYWTVWTIRHKIQRANLDGSGVETLYVKHPRYDRYSGGQAGPRGIALDVGAGKMYWTDPSWHRIQRANLDGRGVEDVFAGGEPTGIALDVGADKMYWTDETWSRIYRANLDGSVPVHQDDIEHLVTTDTPNPTENVSYPYGIALDVGAGKMYWTQRHKSSSVKKSVGRDPSRWNVWRANLDGSGVENLILAPRSGFGIALDVGN